MKDKFDFVTYKLYSKKLKNNESIKVILIADLHEYFKNKKKASELIDAIKEENPHHIIIAGDIMQGKKWESEKKVLPFVEFLKSISEVAPVFISQGNHDLVNVVGEVRNKSFKKLENINPGRIYVLINDVVEYDGFKILGYTPETKNIVNDLDIQEHGIAHDIFIKEYQEYGIKINKQNKLITEFVGHNPFLIARSENNIGLGDLKYVNTFYAGHLHNGYRRSSTISKNPDKYLYNGYVEQPYSVDKNRKIIKKSIKPYMYSKTILCRGTIYIDDNSNRKILQLRNNNFYFNNSNKNTKDSWKKISLSKAKLMIEENNLHALVITGGIRKFFKLNIPGDKPEITRVIYRGYYE